MTARPSQITDKWSRAPNGSFPQQLIRAVVIKIGELLCYMFLLAFLALTAHKQQWRLEYVGATDQ